MCFNKEYVERSIFAETEVKKAKLSMSALCCQLVVDFFAMIILVGFYWFVRDIINYITTQLIITNKKVSGKTGLINTNELDSPLNKINSVQVQQNLFGKIFNYGTINITTSSSSFSFKFISKPNEFKKILNNQIDIFDDERIEKQAKKIAESISKEKIPRAGTRG